MKLLVYIFLFLFVKVSFAQKQDSVLLNEYDLGKSKPETFTVVEEMPEFPGGAMEMMRFIQKNINYPLSAKENGWGGKVFLKFIVRADGLIDSVFVLKSTGYKIIDDEGIKVVKSMPKWKPGMQNGKPVSVYFNLPINFELRDERQSDKLYNSALKDFENGKYSEAKNKYKQAYALNSRNSDALYNLGIVCYKLNQKDSACVYWNEMKTKFHTNDTDVLIKKYCTN